MERASLLRDVWGYDYAGGSNVIEALVKSLRRKLGDRASAIETVRGVGYRFVPSAPDRRPDRTGAGDASGQPADGRSTRMSRLQSGSRNANIGTG